MDSLLRRSLLMVACSLCATNICSAETIVKLNLGSTGPDIHLQNGVLSTVDDEDNSASSPGDQGTGTTFHGFVDGVDGIVDINAPAQSSFSLSGVSLLGSSFAVELGAFSLITQATTGGLFELFDENGGVLLTGSLTNGSLHGTSGLSAAGGFLTADLGSFTGPNDHSFDKLFSLLAPGSASLAMSLTDVSSGPNGKRGFQVLDDMLQDFSADASANIGADPIPEPTSLGLLLVGFVGVLGSLRRR